MGVTDSEAFAKLQQIEANLLAAKQALDLYDFRKESKNMAVSPQVAALIEQFNQATNAIAARIQALVAGQGNLSADDLAAFNTEIANLQALGQNPDQPVPPAA